MSGLEVEITVPSRFVVPIGHVEHREKHYDAPHRRSMGSDKNLFARRKEGTDFSVDIMINTDETEKGPVAIAILRDLTERNEFERKQTLLTQTLQGVLTEIKVLRGLLPICAHCKQIRDDQGSWHQMEVYIRDHSDANFSHGICPTCININYPGFSIKSNPDQNGGG